MAQNRPPIRLDRNALKWALRHVMKFGDTVFVPPAFEYEAIRHQWQAISKWLLGVDMRHWTRRQERRFLANKSPYTFRYVTQLDPLEHLVFTSLVYQIGTDLESQRIPTADEVVYSWRFAPDGDGTMYDRAFRFSDFNRRCLELAEDASCRYVVVADIADFFPHLYLHPIERTLSRVTNTEAAWCLIQMIKNWNGKVSYGIPVGLSASRIIAEATIADIDRSLIAEGFQHCRYSDDFRMFCDSEASAFTALEFLSSSLFEHHGLTLNSEKTHVIDVDAYKQRFILSPQRLEVEGLSDKIQEWLAAAGIEDEYEDEIEIEDLPEDVQQELNELNLGELFDETVARDRVDPVIIHFLLHRMGQLGIDHTQAVVGALGQLSHVMDAVVRYFLRLEEEADTAAIGESILHACREEPLSHYHRTCLLSVFAQSMEFNHESEFARLLNEIHEPRARRELILAIGRAGGQEWFMARRRDLNQLDPWQRRAFLAAFSCVDADARRPFYRSLGSDLDPLDDAVIKWATANPF